MRGLLWLAGIFFVLVIVALLTFGCASYATPTHHPDTPSKYDKVHGWNHGGPP